MRSLNPGIGHECFKLLAHAVDGIDTVVDKVDLTAARELVERCELGTRDPLRKRTTERQDKTDAFYPSARFAAAQIIAKTNRRSR